MQRSPSRPLLTLLILLAVMALACSNATEALESLSDDDNWTDVSELERSETPIEGVAGGDSPATSAAGRKPPSSSTPILVTSTLPVKATNTPAVTATPQPQSLELISHGFRQEEDVLSYAFLVSNPNQEMAWESTPYEVTAFNEDGTTITTSSGYLNVVLAEQTTGYANTLHLEEDDVVASVKVQLGEGRIAASEPLPSFTVEKIRTFSDTPVPSLTAIITNPHESAFNDIRLSAVLFDENDQISGGSFTFTNFVPANGAAGLRMFVDGLPQVLSNGGRVEVYPLMSSLSMASTSEMPPDAAAATLLQSGYGSNGREVGYGLLLENPNDEYDIESLRYRVTAYAADGSVLGTNSGYAPRLPAAKTVGLSNNIFLAAAEPVEHLEVQISGGRFEQPDTAYQPLTTEAVRFEPGHATNHATGFVVNPYEQDVTNLVVSAILYDEAGQIIGGGFTFLDEVTARGRTPIEVRVITDGEPASVELHVTLSGLSEFR